MANLPATVNRALELSASIAITEGYASGHEAAANAEEWPFAARSGLLDEKLCPLCAYLEGRTLKVGSADYKRLAPPSHDNCRCTWQRVHRDEPGAGIDEDFDRDELERLIDQHGDMHLRPNRSSPPKMMAELFPMEPMGVDVEVIRLRHIASGETIERLTYTPYANHLSVAGRDAVLKALAAETVEDYLRHLANLGIRNFAEPAQIVRMHTLGVWAWIEGYRVEPL